MIKHVTLACLLVALAAAAPQQPSQPVEILRYDNNVDVNGYNFEFETNDGTSRQEKGVIENPDSENAILKVVGSYSYVAPDGKKYKVEFMADENGFQPHSSLEK